MGTHDGSEVSVCLLPVETETETRRVVSSREQQDTLTRLPCVRTPTHANRSKQRRVESSGRQNKCQCCTCTHTRLQQHGNRARCSSSKSRSSMCTYVIMPRSQVGRCERHGGCKERKMKMRASECSRTRAVDRSSSTASTKAKAK